MADVIKRGYVYCCLRGALKVKWHKRWCLFHTEDGQTKLDFFPGESDVKIHPSLSIPLTDVQSIERQTVKDRDHVFCISAKDKSHLFSTDSEFDSNNWVKVIESMRDCSNVRHGVQVLPKISNTGSQDSLEDVIFDENILYEAAEKPDIFVVEVGDNEAARRCRLNGEYLLNVNTMNISLSVREDPLNALYVFPFRYIRRYGKSKTSFTFEAGRKCLSGEGIFSLRTTQSAEILLAIQAKINAVKQRQSSPVAPPRKLGGMNYENIPKPNKFKHDSGSQADPSFMKRVSSSASKPAVPQKPKMDSPISGQHKPSVQSKALYAMPDEPEDSCYGDIYSDTNKSQDAWKNQGVTQIMHEENYGNMQKRKSAGTRFSGAVLNNTIDKITDSVKECDLDDDEGDSYDKLSFKKSHSKGVDNSSTYACVGGANTGEDVIYSAEDTYEDAAPIKFTKEEEYDYIGHGQLSDRK